MLTAWECRVRGLADLSAVRGWQAEVEYYLEVDARKLRLAYEAVDHDLFKAGDASATRAQVASYGITKPFALFVSSLWPYKNCDGLLRAWTLARSELGDRRSRTGREVCRSAPRACVRTREQCLKPMDRPGGVYLPGDRVESQAMTGVGAPAGKVQPDAHRRP
jgi:hypothetical protein